MSFNFDKLGRPIARIVNGKYNNKILYVNPDDNDGFKSLELKDGCKFDYVPNTEADREIAYFVGPSGSGKSTSVHNYLLNYKKIFKDRQIYLFSNLTEDESLDDLGIKRVSINESLYTDPIDPKLFTKSCVIFDDCDCINDKKIREAVLSIMNQLLQCGRHYYTTCLITNHIACNGAATRNILNEAHTITYYPAASGRTR